MGHRQVVKQKAPLFHSQGERYYNKVEVWDYRQVGKLINLCREVEDR